MNELIREMYYECQDEGLSTEECYQNFAEMMIKECAELFDRNEQSELGYRISDRIYKHFGVE